MTQNRFISGIKTAGVVVTAALTMSSCGNKALSEQEAQIVKHKTDSAANVHPEYRTATSVLSLCEYKVENYRKANKDLLMIYARDYIKNNIQDAALARFMIKTIEDRDLLISLDSCNSENDDFDSGMASALKYIRENQRWYNDLLLYLSDKYNEKQLLNSEFFKVIADDKLKNKFKRNMKQIEAIQPHIEFASGRKDIIYNQLTDKYTKQVQKQR